MYQIIIIIIIIMPCVSKLVC